MKIASISRSDIANSMYRSHVPARALRQRGHQVDLFEQFKGEPRIPLEQLRAYDVVQVYRLVLNEDPDYIDKLHEAGIVVCYDNDDDFRCVTPEMWGQMNRAYGMEEEMIARTMRETDEALSLLSRADVVTTPSRVLAERFVELGAENVAVVPNYLPPGIGATSPSHYDGIVIGWQAGMEHLWDALALGVKEILRRLLDEHPDVRVVTVGIPLGVGGVRHQHVGYVALPELFNRIAGFDIGIAPLADIPFNQGRSDVKLREYAAAGVPWVASAVGPYLEHGSEQGGELVEDDGWFDALDRLVRSPRECGKRRRKARKWAKREHIGHMATVWEDLMLGALDARRAA